MHAQVVRVHVDTFLIHVCFNIFIHTFAWSYDRKILIDCCNQHQHILYCTGNMEWMNLIGLSLQNKIKMASHNGFTIWHVWEVTIVIWVRFGAEQRKYILAKCIIYVFT